MIATPLQNLRVVDLTDLRGALAARLLADLGAEVVRVERGAVPASQPAAHLFRNANKRCVALSLDVPADRDRLEALCGEADILLENLDGASRVRLGLAPEETRARHPRLAQVSIADFGLDGPHAAWRLEPLPAFAASGALFASGLAELPPCWLPGRVAHDCASVFAALAALVAALDLERQGGAQHVEVSVQEAAMSGLNPWAIPLEDYQRVYPILPKSPPRNGDGSYLVLPASDGHVRIVLGNVKHWRGFLALLDEPEALQGEQWESLVFRMLSTDVIRLVASERTATRSRAELFAHALGTGVPLAPVHRPEEFVASEQSRARGFFRTVALPNGGEASVAGPPWRLGEDAIPVRPPVTATAADATGFAPRPAAPSWPAGATPAEAPFLEGVRVVEFGVAAVVPELCWMLSELGAEVIKIESRAHLDVLRTATIDGQVNRSWTFNDECRGRKSICLDMTSPRGRELALALCARADVVAENYRGSVLRQLGVDYERVRAVNPSVVYFSSQGYGCGGPLAAMQSFGPLNSAFAGVHWLWNHAGAPYPAGTSLAHPDHIAGKLGALVVLAALDHRRRTGEGAFIDLAQTEAAAYLVGDAYLGVAAMGVQATPPGNRSQDAVPHDLYPCAGDDRWVAIAVTDDDAWRRLVAHVGWEEEPTLATLVGRLAARERIDARLAAWTRERSAEQVTEELQGRGISAMPVQGPDDHRADPHLAARGAIVTVEHLEVGAERHIGNPIRLSKTRLRTAGAAPLLGADTEAVLADVLGLTAVEIADLVASGVCR